MMSFKLNLLVVFILSLTCIQFATADEDRIVGQNGPNPIVSAEEAQRRIAEMEAERARREADDYIIEEEEEFDQAEYQRRILRGMAARSRIYREAAERQEAEDRVVGQNGPNPMVSAEEAQRRIAEMERERNRQPSSFESAVENARAQECEKYFLDDNGQLAAPLMPTTLENPATGESVVITCNRDMKDLKIELLEHNLNEQAGNTCVTEDGETCVKTGSLVDGLRNWISDKYYRLVPPTQGSSEPSGSNTQRE